jgi:hypothetical protein
MFVKGMHASATGAILAGCRHFFGYPITPSTEGAELMSAILPTLGGTFVQAMSEVAAINMMFGCGGAGLRSLTFTSSPGFSLMLEGLSYCVGAEVPFRVGTLQGTATLVALSSGGDPLSHRSAFRARPTKDAPALRSGDFGRIGVKGAGGPRRAVPLTAVVQRGDLSGVFVFADGRAALRWLRFGAPEGDQLPVLAGLSPGERVIAAPASLQDGQRVEVAGD